MRKYTMEQEERQTLLNLIQHVSDANIQLMSQKASNSKKRRRQAETATMEENIARMKQNLAEKEAEIGRLWMKLVELQERERELTARSSGVCD